MGTTRGSNLLVEMFVVFLDCRPFGCSKLQECSFNDAPLCALKSSACPFGTTARHLVYPVVFFSAPAMYFPSSKLFTHGGVRVATAGRHDAGISSFQQD